MDDVKFSPKVIALNKGYIAKYYVHLYTMLCSHCY